MGLRASIACSVLVVLVLVGCESERAEPLDIAPKGPPRVDLELVAKHAEQFDRDLPGRVPGSQGEFAAATYLLAHLQDAGYVVELDYVPVEDLVRSTNVIAAAPGGAPRAVVVAAYDEGSRGETIGLFLELARAMRAKDPEHRVEFVALGAESADIGDGALGSRRLARRMLDDDLHPVVVELAHAEDGGALSFYGDEAEELGAAIDAVGADSGEVDRVWDRAGFPYVVMSGDPTELGEALLTYLEGVAG